MTRRPYELLARFAPDGSVAGCHVRYITTVDGRDYESDPQPLTLDDPAFTEFADQFSASIVAERDALKVKADEYDALKTERDKIAAELDVLKNPPKAESITPRQAKLALYGAGLLDDVERMIAEADKTVQIHYAESVVWYRSDPVLNGLAAQLGLTSEQLDDLFLQASEL